jgi:hypothetical protein
MANRSNDTITPATHNANKIGQISDGHEKGCWAGSSISANAGVSPVISTGNGAKAEGKWKLWLSVVSNGSADKAESPISHILYLTAGLCDRSSLSPSQTTPSKKNACKLQVSSECITSLDKEMI